MSETEKVKQIMLEIMSKTKDFLISELEKTIVQTTDENIKIKLINKLSKILISDINIQNNNYDDIDEKNIKYIFIKGTDLKIEKMSREHFYNFSLEIQKKYDMDVLINYPKTVRIYEAIKRLHQSGKLDQEILNDLVLKTKN